MTDAPAPQFSPEDADLAAERLRIDRGGYVRIIVAAKPRQRAADVLAHRVVFGRIVGRSLTSDEVVDHINFVTTDNRRENLRVSTKTQSLQNRRGYGFSGYRGVYTNGCGWNAVVKHKGKVHYCGYFADPKEAAEAAAAKRKELGFFGADTCPMEAK